MVEKSKPSVDEGIKNIIDAIANAVGVNAIRSSEPHEILWELRLHSMNCGKLLKPESTYLDWLAACFDFQSGVRQPLSDLLRSEDFPLLISGGLRQIFAAAVDGFKGAKKNQKLTHKALLSLADYGDFYLSALAAEDKNKTTAQKKYALGAARRDLEAFFASSHIKRDYARTMMDKYLNWRNSVKF